MLDWITALSALAQSALALAFIAAISVIVGILFWSDARWLRRMPTLDSSPAAPAHIPPLVSIVIPARNEEAGIARCLAGALHQRHAACEVIVVDDGSTDATPQVLAQTAAQFDRLRVVQGRPLPPGWIGKCNACQHGSEFATGEWLLFLDADTEAGPNLVANLLATARRHQLDALSAFPLNQFGTWAERLILPIFWRLVFTVFPTIHAWNPTLPPHLAMAVGQCLMIRRSAYIAVGGHGVVRDKVLEDVEFAQVIRRAGYRLAVVAALDDIAVRMYQNAAQVRQGLAKHAHAGQRLSGWRAYWGMISNALLSVVPVCMLLLSLVGFGVGWWDVIVPLASAPGYVLSLLYWVMWHRRLFRQPYGAIVVCALLAPVGVLAHMTITGLGVLRVATKRGVVWKGRAYEG